MEENKQKEEKPKGVFSEPERKILAGLSQSAVGISMTIEKLIGAIGSLDGAIDRLTTQVMELTKKKQ